jgi:hypothetical protein
VDTLAIWPAGFEMKELLNVFWGEDTAKPLFGLLLRQLNAALDVF